MYEERFCKGCDVVYIVSEPNEPDHTECMIVGEVIGSWQHNG